MFPLDGSSRFYRQRNNKWVWNETGGFQSDLNNRGRLSHRSFITEKVLPYRFDVSPQIHRGNGIFSHHLFFVYRIDVRECQFLLHLCGSKYQTRMNNLEKQRHIPSVNSVYYWLTRDVIFLCRKMSSMIHTTTILISLSRTTRFLKHFRLIPSCNQISCNQINGDENWKKNINHEKQVCVCVCDGCYVFYNRRQSGRYTCD